MRQLMETAESRTAKRHSANGNAKPLRVRERLRHQWDALDLQRRILEDMNQSVRYALIIFGTVNTAVVFVMLRVPYLTSLPGSQLAIRVTVASYALFAFAVLIDAVRLLRWRVSGAEFAAWRRELAERGYDDQVLLSLFPFGNGQASLDARVRAWQNASGEQLSVELTQLCGFLSTLFDTKAASLRRLYTALSVMLPLAAVVVAGIAFAAIAST